MSLAKEEKLLELLKETEEDLMDELEADIIKKVNYHENINVWKAQATRMIGREPATAGEGARFGSVKWTNIKQTNVNINSRGELLHGNLVFFP